MDIKTFRHRVRDAFCSSGFSADGSVLRFGTEDIEVIVSCDWSSLMRQFSVDVGFWIKSLGILARPEKVHKSDMYFRIERLFGAENYETIMMAGAIDKPGQEEAFVDFIDLIAKVISPKLQKLCVLDELRQEFEKEELDKRGLVRWQTREFLQGKINGRVPDTMPN